MSYNLSSKAEWVRRVSLTLGAEALCDRNWRFVAISSAMATGLHVSETAIVGRKLSEIPLFRPYAGALAAVPFFDGTFRALQMHSEAWIGAELAAWNLDFWSMYADDGDMLVHIVSNKARAKERGPRFEGFRVSAIRATFSDGRVVEIGPDYARPIAPPKRET